MKLEYLAISLGALSFLFLITIFMLLIRIRKIKLVVKILSLSYKKLSDIVLPKKNNELDEDAHKENFIKFLSDSRDWAFEYIEDVQDGLNKFISEVDPLISYFDEYGDTLSINRPDYDAMKKISIAYKELVKLMPSEEKE